MISSVAWVPKGAANFKPSTSDPPSNEEIEKLMKLSLLQATSYINESENGDDNLMQQDYELERATSAADALAKTSKSSKMEADSEADSLKELGMDWYDDEEDGVEIFGSNLYYPSNDMDPYLKGQNDDDSEEEEDLIIKENDSIVVCARNVDDVSLLEVWILEDISDGGSHMYVRHEITIPAFPLCMAWLDCYPRPLEGEERGNLIAVGSMEPAIEIWDLDIIDPDQPSASLGGKLEDEKKEFIGYKKGSHRDAVLGLAWNKEYRNILASASADKLVKVWDLTNEECKLTLDHHTDKVQAVAWNPFAHEVLLSGSFDHTVALKDGKSPSHGGFKWSVEADVEALVWDPHQEHAFVVSLENGTVVGYDIRTSSSNLSSDCKPMFTLHAHDKAVSAVAYNPSAPNLLATGSMDKMVKLWDMSSQPSCIASTNPKAGAVFSVAFSEDNPFTLAIGGSKGELKVWDLSREGGFSSRYGSLMAKTLKLH